MFGFWTENLLLIAGLALPLLVAMAFSEHYRLNGPYRRILTLFALTGGLVLISPIGLPMEVLAPVSIVLGLVGAPICWILAAILSRRESRDWH